MSDASGFLPTNPPLAENNSLPGTDFLVRRITDLGNEVDRLRAERAEQNERLHCLEVAPIGLLAIDRDGAIAEANHHARELISLASDDSAATLREVFGDADQEIVNLLDGETNLCTLGDVPIQVTRCGSVEPGQDGVAGNYAYYWLKLAADNDVDESTDAASATDEESLRIETAMQLSDSGLWDVTVSPTDWLSDEFQSWFSESLYRSLGLDPTQMPLSLTALLERVHAADRAATCTAFRRLFEGHSPLREHFCRLQRRDGRYQRFACSGMEVARTDDSVRIIGVLRVLPRENHPRGSVAAKVQATLEMESQQSAARMREDLYEHAPDMIISVCASTGKILDCNQTVCEKTGFSKAELLGRPVIEMYSPSCWGTAKLASDAFRENGHVENIDLEVRKKEGGVIVVNVNVSAIRAPDNTILATRAVWRDMTEIRNLERAQRKRETELAQVMRIATLGELATGIAHEVNQPLASIAAYAAGIVRRMEMTAAEEEIQTAVHRIRDEAERAGAIIRRMREFVRQGEARIETVHFAQLVEGVLPLLPAVQPIIDVQLADGDTLFPCDPIQIQQVLLNLLKNADDAIRLAPPENPQILLQVRSRTEHIEVRVSDNAATEFTANQEEFFDSFFTTKQDGIGLGLPLSRSFVEAHGGKLWFERNPHGGASFVFTIPRETATGAPDDSADPHALLTSPVSETES